MFFQTLKISHFTVQINMHFEFCLAPILEVTAFFLCYTSQLNYNFRLEDNVSHVMGQNSTTPLGEQNSLTPSGNENLNFQLACDQVVLLKATTNLWASWPWVNYFFAVFYCFSVRSYKKALNDWPWLCGKQQVFFSPLNVSQGEVEYWGSRGNKTHHLPWGKSLSAQWLSWFCKNGNLKQARAINCIRKKRIQIICPKGTCSRGSVNTLNDTLDQLCQHSTDTLGDTLFNDTPSTGWSTVDNWENVDQVSMSDQVLIGIPIKNRSRVSIDTWPQMPLSTQLEFSFWWCNRWPWLPHNFPERYTRLNVLNDLQKERWWMTV